MAKSNGSPSRVDREELEAAIVQLNLEIADQNDHLKLLKKELAAKVDELRAWHLDQQRPILQMTSVEEAEANG